MISNPNRISIQALKNAGLTIAQPFITIRGRVNRIRLQAKNLVFIEIRSEGETAQAVVKVPELVALAKESINKETILDINAEIKATNSPIKSCTIQNHELLVSSINIVSQSLPVLPLQIHDINRVSEEDGPKVSMDTRLNNRVLDLRAPVNRAIHQIKTHMLASLRNTFCENDFIEIQTPKMLPGSTEGGTEVFTIKYFDREASLAQSPQLYKQMTLMADFARVFEVGPVFRAENSFTHRHLCEFIGVDMEMEVMDDESEVISFIENLIPTMIQKIYKDHNELLDKVKAVYPSEDLKFISPSPRFTFTEAEALLKEHGPALINQNLADIDPNAADVEDQKKRCYNHLQRLANAGELDDFNTADEILLGSIILDLYKTDFYVITQFPARTRPFYTKALDTNPSYSRGFDVYIRGQEVASGAQRESDIEILEKQMKERDIPIESMEDYLNSFKFGAPPHGGAGFGMERIVTLALGLPDVRNVSLFPRDPKRLSP